MPPRKKPSKPGGGKPPQSGKVRVQNEGAPVHHAERVRVPLTPKERANLAQILREEHLPRSQTRAGQLKRKPVPIRMPTQAKPSSPVPPAPPTQRRDSIFGGVLPPVKPLAREEKKQPAAAPKPAKKSRSHKKVVKVEPPKEKIRITPTVYPEEVVRIQRTYRQLLDLHLKIARYKPEPHSKPGVLDALKKSQRALLERYNEMAHREGFKKLALSDLTELVITRFKRARIEERDLFNKE